MQPLNDDELQALLKQWQAPSAPPALERRIFGKRQREPWFRWLLAASIRVPVPVFLLLLAVLAGLAYVYPRQRQAAPALVVRELKFSDFQPVTEIKPRIIRRNYANNN